MFAITSHVTCVCAAPGVYRLYCESRWVGEAVTVDNDALYVSHSFAENGRVVASLRDDLETHTREELVTRLQDDLGVQWDALPAWERYGTVYKYVVDGGVSKFSILSEAMDTQKMDKYHTYIFG